MIQDLFSWLLATFVIGPVQAELSAKMQAAQAPAAIVSQVRACVVGAAPILVQRATTDPWWGITTSISVAAGLSQPTDVLAAATPDCAAAVGAVRPFLQGARV